MSSQPVNPAVSTAAPAGTAADAGPVLVEPEKTAVDGVVREVSVPPLARPVTRGSLADIPFDNASEAPDEPGAQPQAAGRHLAGRDRARVRRARCWRVAKGLIARGPGGRVTGSRIMARTTYEWTLLDFAALGGRAGHRPHLPDVLRLPDPLDPPGLRCAWLRRGERRTGARRSARGAERLPDAASTCGSSTPGAVDRLAEDAAGRPGRGGDRTARRALGPGDRRHPHLHLGHHGPPQGLRAHPRQLLRRGRQRDRTAAPGLQVGRAGNRRRRCSSCPSRTSSAGWSASPACAHGCGSGTRRASRPRTCSPTSPAFRPTFLLGHPVRAGEGLQHRPRQGREGWAGPPPSTARRASPAATARPSRRRQHGTRRRPRPGPAARPAPSTTRWSTAGSATPWAAGSGTSSAAAPRSAAGSPPFYAGAGIEIFEGYGLTETTGAATVTPPLKPRLGTVGWPLPGTSVRIADDGEVLLNGGARLQRLLGPARRRPSPDAATTAGSPPATSALSTTRATSTITGRKKEIIITSGGKNVAPAPLEDWLRAHPLVAQCMVIGDNRPYITALITLDPEGSRTGARCTSKQARSARQLIEDDGAEADPPAGGGRGQPAGLPRRVHPHASRSCRSDFTEEAGHLTPSLKLKRAAIVKDYEAEIAAAVPGLTRCGVRSAARSGAVPAHAAAAGPRGSALGCARGGRGAGTPRHRWWISSRLMCSTSARHRAFGVRPLGVPARAGEAGLAEGLDPGLPRRVLRVELGQRLVSGRGVLERLVVGGRTAEVRGVAHREDADDTCPRRQAIVVNGAGSGSGIAKSMVIAPAPACTGAAPSPRGRTLQQPGTGSQKYSSSVSPSRRSRSCMVPVPVDLVPEQEVPVLVCHGPSLAHIADRTVPGSAVRRGHASAEGRPHGLGRPSP